MLRKRVWVRIPPAPSILFLNVFDSKKEAWLNAIKNMKMPWTHLSDLAGWKSIGSSIYEINSIPSNILFDGEGKVVDIDLRGEQLESKLAQIFAGNK